MINTNRNQSLDESITRLMAAYQQAMQQSDQSDFLTKAEVTRSVIDSARDIANRLRTREQGTDELVQKLELYYKALHAEDWVEKSTSVVTKAAVIIGFNTAVMVSLVISFLLALFEGSIEFGSNLIRYIVLYPSAFYVTLHFLRGAYGEFSSANNTPSMAINILSRTVDPVEQQVYALIGGNRPARTFEKIDKGGAIAMGGILFVVVCGILSGFLLSL